MTKNEKYIIAVFSMVLVILAGLILVRYYDRVSDYYAASDSVENSEDLIPISGYTFTTASGELTITEDPEDRTARRTFIHEVSTPENHALAVITVTVTGSISNDSYAISHVSTSLSEEQMDGLTISEHIFGQTATIVLYVNQISVCHFQYRLSSDGSIYSL